MKILILGSTGFIGKNLLAALISKEYDAIGRSRQEGLDLTVLQSAKEHLSNVQPDVIINCAAHVGSVHYGLKYPATIIYDNMMMILNLYKIVSEICPNAMLINPVSNCSYPMQAEIQSEPEWWAGQPHPTALPYASTRRMIYVISKSYKEQYGIKSKNFIFPGVYGPGDHIDTDRVHALDGMIIRMIQAQRENLPEFEVWGTGKPVREWCYVDDIVRLLIKSITMPEDLTYPVNFGQKKGYSIRESAEMIAELVGYEGKLVFNTKYADGAAIKILDDTKFRTLFPDFVFTDMKTGIQRTVEYYESVL